LFIDQARHEENALAFHFAEFPVGKQTFTRSTSKMSRHFPADAHAGDGKRLGR
jgi:hypothetical protein